MLSVLIKNEIAKVIAFSPIIISPFLYHLNVLPLSASLSGSEYPEVEPVNILSVVASVGAIDVELKEGAVFATVIIVEF